MLRESVLGFAGAMLLASWGAGPVCAADSAFEREASNARTVEFMGLRPVAGFNRSNDLLGSWSVVAIYVQGPQSPHGPWVARRVAKPSGAAKATWTDAASCPALVTSLALLERLAPQRLEIQGMSPYRPMRAYVADGARQTVWSSGGAQPDGAPVDVEWASTSGALAQWGETAEQALAACWRQDPPP